MGGPREYAFRPAGRRAVLNELSRRRRAMKKTPIVLATLLLAAVVARGGVGDLSHVACDVKDALKPQSLS